MDRPRKTFDDFPHFVVSEVAGANVLGTFDNLKGVGAGRCWLLLPDRTALIGDLESFDPETASGTFNSADDISRVSAGQRWTYLSGYWQAYHIWMTLDDSPWEKVCFHAVDAISEAFTTEDGSRYHKISKAPPGQQLSPQAQVVVGGWDHEHCELCNAHIDPGDYAYMDRDGVWVCLRCFTSYVAPKDLSFVDEL